MAKADRLREELAWLKLFFAAFLAIDVSVIAWLAQNYGKAEIMVAVSALVVVIAITGGLVFIIQRAYKRIEQLEQL